MRNDYNVDETMWRIQFGDKLKRLIHIKNMTQGEFAAELGVTDVTLSRYITGTFSPSLYRVVQMARILECTTDCLLNVDD